MKNAGVLYALAAAALFGASTPLAKALGLTISPVLLAGLLYLGSGLGLALLRAGRDRAWVNPGLSRAQWPWLLGAIVAGGLLGPVALMIGLARTTGATASLLLNLESVLTALLAWLLFKEQADRRIVLGMFAIVVGGVVLARPAQGMAAQDFRGPLAVAFACLCWAVDNNLTRKVSACDALFVAGLKGLVAGVVNTALALALGAQLPALALLVVALWVGFFGYGLSLVLFVLALRGLGSARTGAYFATAPFLGAALSLAVLGESVSLSFCAAAALMATGVGLHLAERHAHEHLHDWQVHTHRHHHDEHHQHAHDFEWDAAKPHSHPHEHLPLRHHHVHFPDIHHRHEH